MLKAAHLRRSEGIDIQVGYVETHDRPETEELLEGLTLIPPGMIVEYRGVALPEVLTSMQPLQSPANARSCR